MTSRGRIIALSAAVLTLAFGAAYVFASGGDDPSSERATPTPDPVATIETPDGVEIPGVPPGGGLPDLQVPTPESTAEPGADATAEPTAAPGEQATPAPTAVPQQTAEPQQTAQPTETPFEEGGED